MLRRGPGSLYRRLVSLHFLLGRDRRAVLRFLATRYPIDLPATRRLALVGRFVTTTNHVRAYHSQAELLAVADRILRLAGQPGLTVVEAGCGKGASTAKLSLVTALAGGHLHGFDSFRGVPPNDERDAHLDGRPVEFRAGAFRGRMAEVRRTVARFGVPSVCTLHRGWLADTLPRFNRPIDVALLDVDLVSSTRTCLVHLVPRLRPGGVLFTQDGHLRGVVALLGDHRFWRDEVGVAPPTIEGLGRRKLLAISSRSARSPSPSWPRQRWVRGFTRLQYWK